MEACAFVRCSAKSSSKYHDEERKDESLLILPLRGSFVGLKGVVNSRENPTYYASQTWPRFCCNNRVFKKTLKAPKRSE